MIFGLVKEGVYGFVKCSLILFLRSKRRFVYKKTGKKITTKLKACGFNMYFKSTDNTIIKSRDRPGKGKNHPKNIINKDVPSQTLLIKVDQVET